VESWRVLLGLMSSRMDCAHIFAVVRHGGDGVWNAVRHVRVKREAWLVCLVGSRERNALRGRRPSADDVEVEAVQVNLNLAFEVLPLELLHISVHGNEFGSQDIVARLDIAGQLEFEAVAIVVGEFVRPPVFISS
jgi:hypothetical protein